MTASLWKPKTLDPLLEEYAWMNSSLQRLRLCGLIHHLRNFKRCWCSRTHHWRGYHLCMRGWIPRSPMQCAEAKWQHLAHRYIILCSRWRHHCFHRLQCRRRHCLWSHLHNSFHLQRTNHPCPHSLLCTNGQCLVPPTSHSTGLRCCLQSPRLRVLPRWKCPLDWPKLICGGPRASPRGSWCKRSSHRRDVLFSFDSCWCW